MTADALQPIKDRLRWANEHLHKVRDLTDSFLKSDFYGFTAKSYKHDRGHRLDIVVTRADPMPVPLSLMMGDAAHSMRGALDNLMWLLAKPARGKEHTISFPIVYAKRHWKGRAFTMHGAPRGVRTLVESLQPYHSRKWPETAFLGQLRALNDWDKHRKLAAAAVLLEGSRLEIKTTGLARVLGSESFRRRFEPNAVFARVQVGESEQGAQVHVKPEFTFSPVFDRTMPKQVRGRQILTVLIGTYSFIKDEILPRFEHFF